MEWAGSIFQVVVEVCTGAAVLAMVASFIDISAENHQIKFSWVLSLSTGPDELLPGHHATFPFCEGGSLFARIDLTRSADDAPSSDNP